MDRVMRLLVPAVLVFLVAGWFFSIQPWVPASGWERWQVIILRGGEIMALYALAHGLWVWCKAEPPRWIRLTRASTFLGVLLVAFGVFRYYDVKISMGSPLIPSYLIAYLQEPQLARIVLGLLVLLVAIGGRITGFHRIVLITTSIAFALYWLAPELHNWLRVLPGSDMVHPDPVPDRLQYLE